MCDLVIAPYNPVTKDRDTIISSWAQNKPYNFDRAGVVGTGVKYAEDYFWGLASYGTWHRKHLDTGTFDYSHDTFDFHPWVYTRRMVYKIIEDAGYSLDSKFWDSITASLLCHPFTSGENYYQNDPASMLGSSGSQLGHAKHPEGPCGGNYKSGGKIPAGGYPRSWWPCLDVESDWSNNITGCVIINLEVHPIKDMLFLLMEIGI